MHQTMALLLIPCLLTGSINAVPMSIPAIGSPNHPVEFLIGAVTPELAMSERLKMYSLGSAGSSRGFRRYVLNITRRIWSRVTLPQDFPSTVLPNTTLIVGDLDGHSKNLLSILQDARYIGREREHGLQVRLA